MKPSQSSVPTSEIRREILRKSHSLPSLSEVVTETLRLLNSQETEIGRFEAVLSKDPGLVAKMLRVVNSPFFGQAREISSIPEAIVVLGFRSLRSLVLAASTVEYLRGDFYSYGHEPSGLWRHSVSVASAARSLAEALAFDRDLAEETFVAGLLHDLGKMVLTPFLLDKKEVLTELAGSETQNERLLLGVDHPEAGSLLMEKWGLGPTIVEAIRDHHGDEGGRHGPEVLAVVRISDSWSREVGHGFQSPMPAPYREGDFEHLGLSASDWEDLQPSIGEKAGAALALLGQLAT